MLGLCQCFSFVRQKDAMQCGVASLSMICQYYGKNYSINYLSNLCHATMEGISMLAMSKTAIVLGLSPITFYVSPLDLTSKKLPLPCILHWNQNHFVVLYKIKKGRKFYIADPGKGLVTYSREEFESHWISTFSDGEGKGIAMFFETTPEFYTINRWELTHELQIRISPFAKIDEIRALFGYDKENILKNKQTMGDIIRNEWVNINYFGDMFINAQGEVLIATGRSIGKLSTKEVKMDMYFSKNSLWRATRKQFSKCQMCIFRNICPPLTEIEIMFNVTFCNIINYE